jgi:hypothetical protein
MTRRDDSPEWISRELVGRLDGRLWHATDKSELIGILSDGMIRPDAPPRHANGFSRSIGAISMFDFAEADTAIPRGTAHWSEWMRPDGLTRYWLEIDREAATGQLRDTAQTLLLWKAMPSATAGRIIAGMEAVHIGPIPIKNVAEIISVVGGRQSLYRPRLPSSDQRV